MDRKKKILVFGGSGLVGSRFIDLNKDYFEIDSPSETEVDLLDSKKLSDFILHNNAEVIVNFAAYTNVGFAEEDKGNKDGLAYKLNALSVSDIAKTCNDSHKHLVHISTEYVFDGNKTDGLYQEDNIPSPINWYGQTKYFGEQFVLESGCDNSVVRISMPYRARYEERKDIARKFLEMLKAGQEISGCSDVINTPGFIDDISQGLKLVVERKHRGILHITSADSISPYEFSRLIAKKFGFDENLIKPITFLEYSKNSKAPLLKNSGLDTSKFKTEYGEEILHSISEALDIFEQQIDL